MGEGCGVATAEAQLVDLVMRVRELTLSGQADRALAVAQPELAQVRHADPQETTQSLLVHVAKALVQLGLFPQAEEILGVATRMAEELGQPLRQVQPLVVRAAMRVRRGRADDALITLAEAVATLQRAIMAGSADAVSSGVVQARHDLAEAADELGLLEFAEAWFVANDQVIEAVAPIFWRWLHLAAFATHQLVSAVRFEHLDKPVSARDRLVRAAELAARLRALPDVQDSWRVSETALDGCIRVRTGRAEDVLRRLEGIGPELETRTNTGDRLLFHLARAQAWACIGDAHEARVEAATGLRLARETGAARWEAEAWRLHAEAVRLAGRHDAAEQIEARFIAQHEELTAQELTRALRFRELIGWRRR
jgi:tetratricopeptide (TPR) repeat protein